MMTANDYQHLALQVKNLAILGHVAEAGGKIEDCVRAAVAAAQGGNESVSHVLTLQLAELKRLREQVQRVGYMHHCAELRVSEFGGYRFRLWCALDCLVRQIDSGDLRGEWFKDALDKARTAIAETRENQPLPKEVA